MPSFFLFSFFIFYFKEILIDAFRVIVNNPFKESFYREKKVINILTVFSIFHKKLCQNFPKIDC